MDSASIRGIELDFLLDHRQYNGESGIYQPGDPVGLKGLSRRGTRLRDQIKRETNLCIGYWCFEQLLEVLVAFLILVSGFAPLRHSLSMENKDMEERIEKEDDVGLDGDAIQQHRLRCDVESVGH